MTAKVMPSVNVVIDPGTMSWASNQTATTRTTPQTTALRTVGTAYRSRVRVAAPRSRSCGSTSSTMKRMIIGRVARKLPTQVQEAGAYPTRYVADMPSTIAPTNVRGMLRRRPNIAAANASITSSVSALASSAPPPIGVIRMPASTASTEPRRRRRVAPRRATADRGDQDAGQHGEHRTHDPGEERDPLGVVPGELQQVGVVDNAPHGHAHPRPVEEQAETDRDRDGQHQA